MGKNKDVLQPDRVKDFLYVKHEEKQHVFASVGVSGEPPHICEIVVDESSFDERALGIEDEHVHVRLKWLASTLAMIIGTAWMRLICR